MKKIIKRYMIRYNKNKENSEKKIKLSYTHLYYRQEKKIITNI